MRIASALMAALAALSPAAVLACPYASGSAGAAADCAACHGGGSSVLGYGAALLLGLGIGIASIAFERRGCK